MRDNKGSCFPFCTLGVVLTWGSQNIDPTTLSLSSVTLVSKVFSCSLVLRERLQRILFRRNQGTPLRGWGDPRREGYCHRVQVSGRQVGGLPSCLLLSLEPCFLLSGEFIEGGNTSLPPSMTTGSGMECHGALPPLPRVPIVEGEGIWDMKPVPLAGWGLNSPRLCGHWTWSPHLHDDWADGCPSHSTKLP